MAPYPRQKSNTWYLKRRPYQIFMLRELSAVFLAIDMILLLILVAKVHDGPAALQDYEQTLRNPFLLALQAIILLFALLHTVTWFQAVPKALPLRRGEDLVPPSLLIASNYLAMGVVSAALLVLVLV